MAQTGGYNFENPAFIAEPIGGEIFSARREVSNTENRNSSVTEIRISDDTVAIARDNPMYESADEVLRKHSGVVHNPIFVDDSLEEENVEDKGSRLWQQPDQLKFSKDFF